MTAKWPVDLTERFVLQRLCIILVYVIRFCRRREIVQIEKFIYLYFPYNLEIRICYYIERVSRFSFTFIHFHSSYFFLLEARKFVG